MPLASDREQDNARQEAEAQTTGLAQDGQGLETRPDTTVLKAGLKHPDPEIQSLRKLIFEQELDLLRKLERQMADPIQHAQDLSTVIAEALLIRSRKDTKLQRTIEPMVEELLSEAIRKKPMDFVNVLFPLMGPAIRRSIAETFRSMLESFHKTVEYIFSWRGLKWRWEALRTGKSFSEVVLLNTLAYRVEQIFFIHAETGLVLSHVSSEGVETQDADMVSAMFTAIQDFVRDAFSTGAENSLNSLQLGEHTIFVERGQFAYLACVVRGTAPMEFRQKLGDVFSLMLARYNEALQRFDGDTKPFEAADWELEGLLETHYMDENEPVPLWAKLIPALVLLFAIMGGGWLYYEKRQEAATREKHYAFMQSSAEKIATAPGLILLQAKEISPGHWEYVFQKDAMAPDPAKVLSDMGIARDSYDLRIIPYISYEPAMVAERIKERITPPSSVTMDFSEGVLRLSGTAPMGWILNARQEALALPGVDKVDMSGLTDPRINELQTMVREVESTVVRFDMGKATPIPEDTAKLAKAMDTLVKIERLGREMNIAVSLTIYGHADATGSDKRNFEISEARTRTLAAMLYTRGASIPIAMYGMGSEHARRDGIRINPDRESRKVELKVHLAQLPSRDNILNILR